MAVRLGNGWTESDCGFWRAGRLLLAALIGRRLGSRGWGHSAEGEREERQDG